VVFDAEISSIGSSSRWEQITYSAVELAGANDTNRNWRRSGIQYKPRARTHTHTHTHTHNRSCSPP